MVTGLKASILLLWLCFHQNGSLESSILAIDTNVFHHLTQMKTERCKKGSRWFYPFISVANKIKPVVYTVIWLQIKSCRWSDAVQSSTSCVHGMNYTGIFFLSSPGLCHLLRPRHQQHHHVWSSEEVVGEAVSGSGCKNYVFSLTYWWIHIKAFSPFLWKYLHYNDYLDIS